MLQLKDFEHIHGKRKREGRFVGGGLRGGICKDRIAVWKEDKRGRVGARHMQTGDIPGMSRHMLLNKLYVTTHIGALSMSRHMQTGNITGMSRHMLLKND